MEYFPYARFLLIFVSLHVASLIFGQGSATFLTTVSLQTDTSWLSQYGTKTARLKESYFFFTPQELAKFDTIQQKASVVNYGLRLHGNVLVHQDKMYFMAFQTTSDTFGLWRTDGTQLGLELLHGVSQSEQFGIPNILGSGYHPRIEIIGDAIYFQGKEQLTGRELWKYQISVSQGSLVADLDTANTYFYTIGVSGYYAAYGAPQGLVNLNQKLLFYQNRQLPNAFKNDVASYDPITNQITQVSRHEKILDWMPVSGNVVFYVAIDTVHVAHLYRTDGTSAGTRRVLFNGEPIRFSQTCCTYNLKGSSSAVFFRYANSAMKMSAFDGEPRVLYSMSNPNYVTDITVTENQGVLIEARQNNRYALAYSNGSNQAIVFDTDSLPIDAIGIYRGNFLYVKRSATWAYTQNQTIRLITNQTTSSLGSGGSHYFVTTGTKEYAINQQLAINRIVFSTRIGYENGSLESGPNNSSIASGSSQFLLTKGTLGTTKPIKLLLPAKFHPKNLLKFPLPNGDLFLVYANIGLECNPEEHCRCQRAECVNH
jgi:hypothetical protein